MNRQEMFDTVATFLIKQGVAAVDPTTADGNCMYRGPNNTKCAVGCLIPDEMYSPEMEGKSVNQLITNSIFHKTYKLPPFINTSNKQFLEDLQFAHDFHLKNDGVEEFKTKMMAIGADYNLNTGVVK